MTVLIEKARRNVALSILAVAGLGLLLLNPFLYFGWQSAADSQVDLERDEMMADLQLANAQASYDPSLLRDQRDELRGDIEELEGATVFPEEAPGTSLYTRLAEVADERGSKVTLTTLEYGGVSSVEGLGGSTYDRSVVNIVLEGPLDNIQEFLSTMEGDYFPTLKFEDVKLTVSETGSWVGDLKLVVLSQGSSQEG